MERGDFSSEEADRLAALSEEDLFAMLVPQSEASELYSLGGLVTRGRQIFIAKIAALRDQICMVYNDRKSTSDHSVDLIVLIATALVGSPLLANIPVLPFAALAVKIGLAEMCKENDNGA